MFAKQVQTYCKSKASGSDSAQCKKNMMLYGISKLNEMEESHLDLMDPYQRNANTIRKCLAIQQLLILVKYKYAHPHHHHHELS